MSCESFKLIDKDGNIEYMADYGLYIGMVGSGMPSEDFLASSRNTIIDGIIRKDGSIFQSQTLGNRQLSIPVFFEDKTEYEINQLKEKMYCRTPRQLVWDRHSYKAIWVVSNGDIDISYIWTSDYVFTGFFTVPYIAPDPLYYSLLDSSEVLGYLEDYPTYEVLYYDVGYPYLEDVPAWSFSSITTDGSVTLNNYGNYPSKLKIEIIDGTASDLVFTNTANSQRCTISSLSSEDITIDGTRGSVYDGSGLKTNLFSGDFIKVESGENIINITSTSVNLTTLRFIYRYTYL